MDKELRAEIWEIQGILYAILATQTGNAWLRLVIAAYALHCIIYGMYFQHKYRKYSPKEQENL